MTNQSGLSRMIPRRRPIRRLFHGLLCGGAAIVLVGCSAGAPAGSPDTESTSDGTSQLSPSPNEAAVAGGTLELSHTSDPSPDGIFQPRLGNIPWVYSVFEFLTLKDPETAEPRAQVASSWELADDQLSMTIELRDDVTFHTGRPLTAEDVIFALQQAQDPEKGSNVKALADQITEMSATDDLTVELTFSSPVPGIFDLFERVPLVDMETIDGLENGSTVVGTGPFEWGSWTPGSSFMLTKYEDHRGASDVPLDEIVVNIIPDSTAGVAALRSGRTDGAIWLSNQDAVTLASESGFKPFVSNETNYMVGFDVTQAPFDDPAVRQAVAYAIEGQRINDQVFSGNARVTNSFWPESYPGYDAELADHFAYQPDRAEEMLGEAGVAGTTFPMVVPNQPAHRAMYEIVRNNLEAVGFTPEVELAEPTEYNEMVAAGYLGLSFQRSSTVGGLSPATFLPGSPELRPDGNLSQVTDPEYAALVDAVVSAGEDEMDEAVAELNQYLIDEAFVVPVLAAPVLQVLSEDVQAVERTSGGFLNLNSAYIRE